VAEICEIVPGPVSAEVAATDYETMLAEGQKLRKIASNIAVKVPLTLDGLKTCRKLTADGTMVNVTLCFTANQALLAAKAGATFVSPFVGRHDDVSFSGMDLIADIRTIYDNYGFQTQILTASARSVLHVLDAAIAGSDVVTMPFATFGALLKHPLTDIGLKRFTDDFNKIPAELLGDWNAVSSEKKGA
jgi:transaldolase